MTIAGQFALSLDNIRLYAEAQERLSETLTLLAVSETCPARPARRGDASGRSGGGARVPRRHDRRLLPRRAPGGPRAWQAIPCPPSTECSSSSSRSCWHVLPGSRTPGEAAAPPGVVTVAASPASTRSGRATSRPISVLFAAALAHGTPVGGLFLVWWRTGRTFLPSRDPPPRGRGRSGRTRHGEHRPRPADAATPCRDGDAPVHQPRPRVDARSRRASAHVPQDRGGHRGRRLHRPVDL